MIYLVFNIFALIFSLIFLKNYLHVFQLKDYQTCRFFNFFSKKYKFGCVFDLFFAIFCLFYENLYLFLISSVFSILLIILFSRRLIQNKKTPLKLTNKIKRLILLSATILCLSSCFKHYCQISFFILFLVVPIANKFNIYDKIKNHIYICHARKKLRKFKTKIIAITGSNGKTSVKDILQLMLHKKYKAVATPFSFNTPLGISKFINENLTNDIEYLILEFGARKKGQIKHLCKLFPPEYSIITNVTKQHLETFKNIENIYKTKNELAEFPTNRTVVFNLDNIYTLRMFDIHKGHKLGVSTNCKTDTFASSIQMENYSTSFVLNFGNKQYKIQTQLLGRHNITNILLATCLAKYLGVGDDDIINSIRSLTPTPHRLEYIKSNINILDDSYNCSILSAKYAIEALSKQKYKKMIVTPGIIEAGKEQYSINFQLGKLCSIADFVVIVGTSNKKALEEGIKNSTTFNTSSPIKKNSKKAQNNSKTTSGDKTIFSKQKNKFQLQNNKKFQKIKNNHMKNANFVEKNTENKKKYL